MFYVACPYCHIGIEIDGTQTGPECTESGNIGNCATCDETFFFDARDVIRESEPDP
jgi:RecJ-like exonuclease